MRRTSSSPLLGLVATWVLAACGGSPTAGNSAARGAFTLGNCPIADECQTSASLNTATGLCAYTTQRDGTPCGQGNVCIKDATCQGGRCVGTQAMTCTARGPCYLDGACDPTHGCIDVALDGPCVAGVPTMTLTGCSTADYAAPVTLGGTTLSLIVDSGSTTTAAAGTDCQSGCQGLSPVYSRSAGATYGAKVSSVYGDGSGWGGRLVEDSLSLPILPQPAAFTFADMSVATTDSAKSSAFFTASYCTGQPVINTRQGIFGLANQAIASPGATPVMDLVAANGLPNAFATQLCNTAGRLWIGGYDPTYLDAAVTWVPMRTTDGFYEVLVADLGFDGLRMGFGKSDFGLTIVDNGTSNLNLPTNVYQTLISALAANLKFTRFFDPSIFGTNGSCVAPGIAQSREELDLLLPPLTLVLGDISGSGTTYQIPLQPTSSYLMYQLGPQGEDLYCPSVGDAGDVGTNHGIGTILGNSTMRDHVVIFDRKESKVGFAAQKNCIGPDL